MDKAQFLIEQAYVERKESNPSLALDLYQNAAEALRPLDEPLRLAHTIRHIADIQRGLNLSEQAHTNYAEALAIYRAQPLTSRLTSRTPCVALRFFRRASVTSPLPAVCGRKRANSIAQSRCRQASKKQIAASR